MLIDNKNEEIQGPEYIRSNYDHIKLKRFLNLIKYTKTKNID